jgi:hypothetical protein
MVLSVNFIETFSQASAGRYPSPGLHTAPRHNRSSELSAMRSTIDTACHLVDCAACTTTN